MRIEDIQKLAQTLIAPLASVFLRRPLRVRVYNNANISIGDATPTALTFNSERFDEGSFHSTVTNTGRLTAPADGYYLVGCAVRFAANTTNDRYVAIQRNGTAIALDARRAASGISTAFVLATLDYFTVGQYATVEVYQNSGGALNVEYVASYSPEFWMIGPL